MHVFIEHVSSDDLQVFQGNLLHGVQGNEDIAGNLLDGLRRQNGTTCFSCEEFQNARSNMRPGSPGHLSEPCARVTDGHKAGRGLQWGCGWGRSDRISVTPTLLSLEPAGRNEGRSALLRNAVILISRGFGTLRIKGEYFINSFCICLACSLIRKKK